MEKKLRGAASALARKKRLKFPSMVKTLRNEMKGWKTPRDLVKTEEKTEKKKNPGDHGR